MNPGDAEPASAAGRPAGTVFERAATVSAWDADYYPPIALGYYDRAVPDLLRAIGAGPGDLVLDAGCGPGVHSIRAARFGARVQAIDLSETMLAEARQRADAAGLADRIGFARDDLTRLSLPSNAYPFVFSWGVLIHVPDVDAALDHLARILAPGGRLGLHVLVETSLDFAIERAAGRLLGRTGAFERTALGVGRWYDYQNDRLWVQRFHPQRLADALARRGLRPLARRGAEFTELHRRLKGPLRAPLLHWNRLAYGLRLPAPLFCTATLVFEKPPAPGQVTGVGTRAPASPAPG